MSRVLFRSYAVGRCESRVLGALSGDATSVPTCAGFPATGQVSKVPGLSGQNK